MPISAPPGPSLSSYFSGGAATREQLSQFGSQADVLSGLSGRARAMVANAPNSEGRKIRSAAGLSVQQQLGDQETGAVTHGAVLSNALRRAKARVGIRNRGDEAIRNQQLKDRLTQVRAGIAGKARGINEQLSGTNIRTSAEAGVREARQYGKDAVAGALGGSIGAFGALLKGNYQNNGSIFDFGAKNPIKTLPTQQSFHEGFLTP